MRIMIKIALYKCNSINMSIIIHFIRFKSIGLSRFTKRRKNINKVIKFNFRYKFPGIIY